MPKKKQKLWCKLAEIISAKDTMFGKSYKVRVPGVEKELTVGAVALGEVCFDFDLNFEI